MQGRVTSIILEMRVLVTSRETILEQDNNITQNHFQFDNKYYASVDIIMEIFLLDLPIEWIAPREVLMTLLRYNSHTIPFILLKCIIQQI